MSRTRAAALDGARKSIAQVGTRATSMGDIADHGQIARATLYNHFRRKIDVFTALVEDEISTMRRLALDEATFADALSCIAAYLREHHAIRAVAEREPAVVMALTTLTDHELWGQAHSALADVAAAHLSHEPDPEVLDLILRWLTTQISAPLPADRAAPTTTRLAGLL
jgi:AcrR family transcriptional regulator